VPAGHGVQRAARDDQPLGTPLPIALGPFQREKQVPPLDLAPGKHLGICGGLAPDRRLKLARKICGEQCGILSEGGRPLDGMLQLSDIARPRVGRQQGQSLGAMRSTRLPEAWVNFRRKNSANRGMSSTRSRSDGSVVVTTLRR
jgi:hypothetical protein